jgi:hypothetical protein
LIGHLLFSLLSKLPWEVFATIRAIMRQATDASPVIASEAKQSIAPQKEWIASSLRSSQ